LLPHRPFPTRRSSDLRGHQSDVRSLAFARDGLTLVSASFDGTVRLWDPSLRRLRMLHLAGEKILWADLSPDNAYVVAGTASGTRSEEHTSELQSRVDL